MPAEINEFDREIATFAMTEAGSRKWWRICVGAFAYNSPRMTAYMFRALFKYVGRRYEEASDMAKEQRKQPIEEGTKPWQFVNVALTDEEVEAALEQLQDVDVLWEMINGSLEEGYKLSLTVEEESGSFCASLTGKFCPPPNRDKTISGWHDTAVDSLRVVMYKHTIKLGGVWKSPDGGQKRRG